MGDVDSKDCANAGGCTAALAQPLPRVSTQPDENEGAESKKANREVGQCA